MGVSAVSDPSGDDFLASELRTAVEPLAMARETHERPVDVGLGYFVQTPEAGRPRRQGPFLSFGVHLWQRPWRKGWMRFSLRTYGELVAQDVKLRRSPWGSGVAIAASFEAARWVRGASAGARSLAAYAGAVYGEAGFGVELASGYRHIGDGVGSDLWTTTLSFVLRTPSVVGIGIAGGLFR